MPDVFSKEKRSEVMSKIRSRGNKQTELALMDLLRQNRLSGWRRHKSISIGSPTMTASGRTRNAKVRPDFVFPKVKLALFVDGCFWHGCPKHGNYPAANAAFWSQKLDKNRLRDRLVTKKLRGKGWVVLRIWEHDLPSAKVVASIRRALLRCETRDSRRASR